MLWFPSPLGSIMSLCCGKPSRRGGGRSGVLVLVLVLGSAVVSALASASVRSAYRRRGGCRSCQLLTLTCPRWVSPWHARRLLGVSTCRTSSTQEKYFLGPVSQTHTRQSNNHQRSTTHAKTLESTNYRWRGRGGGYVTAGGCFRGRVKT